MGFGCLYIETLRIEDGLVLNYLGHLSRVERVGCGGVFPSCVDLERGCPYRLGRVRCRVVYGFGGVESIEYSEYSLPVIRSLRVVCAPDGFEYGDKYLDRGGLGALYAQRGSADDVLIVRDGFVTDTSFCNVVFRGFCGGYFTPRDPLLRGTMREQLLDGGVVEPLDISVSDLSSFDFVYLVNAMLDISDLAPVPISAVQF